MDVPPDGHYVTSGLMLFPRHEAAIDRILTEVRDRIPVRLAIVTTRDGQFIAASGELINTVDLIGLGSLIAGDLAASHQIARLTGVYGDFQVVLREGADSHIYVSDAGPHMVLFLLAPGSVPVGWVRLLGLEASRLLAKVAGSPPDEVEPQTLGLDDKSLAERFDQALNKIWSD